MQELLNTLSKYPKFLIGVILGVFFNALLPLKALMKNPVTAVAVVGVALGGFACVTFTLRAMLALG
jgi:Protein of unknown function (DUF751)